MEGEPYGLLLFTILVRIFTRTLELEKMECISTAQRKGFRPPTHIQELLGALLEIRSSEHVQLLALHVHEAMMLATGTDGPRDLILPQRPRVELLAEQEAASYMALYLKKLWLSGTESHGDTLNQLTSDFLRLFEDGMRLNDMFSNSMSMSSYISNSFGRDVQRNYGRESKVSHTSWFGTNPRNHGAFFWINMRRLVKLLEAGGHDGITILTRVIKLEKVLQKSGMSVSDSENGVVDGIFELEELLGCLYARKKNWEEALRWFYEAVAEHLNILRLRMMNKFKTQRPEAIHQEPTMPTESFRPQEGKQGGLSAPLENVCDQD